MSSCKKSVVVLSSRPLKTIDFLKSLGSEFITEDEGSLKDKNGNPIIVLSNPDEAINLNPLCYVIKDFSISHSKIGSTNIIVNSGKNLDYKEFLGILQSENYCIQQGKLILNDQKLLRKGLHPKDITIDVVKQLIKEYYPFSDCEVRICSMVNIPNIKIEDFVLEGEDYVYPKFKSLKFSSKKLIKRWIRSNTLYLETEYIILPKSSKFSN